MQVRGRGRNNWHGRVGKRRGKRRSRCPSGSLQPLIEAIDAVQHRVTRTVSKNEERFKRLDLHARRCDRHMQKYIHVIMQAKEWMRHRHQCCHYTSRMNKDKRAPAYATEEGVQRTNQNNFFGRRIVYGWNWNLLPEDIVNAMHHRDCNAPSINYFKGRYDRWNSGACFSTLSILPTTTRIGTRKMMMKNDDGEKVNCKLVYLLWQSE